MKVTRHPLFTPTDQTSAAIPADQQMIAKLEASFLVLSAPGSTWAEQFYKRLFELHPGLRALFPANMAAQQKNLLETLGLVVAHLRRPGEVRPVLLELGRAHVKYGARAEHYPIVVGLMVEAMGRAAPSAWSAELSAEWHSALTMVSAIMMEGAAQAKI